MDNSGAGNAGGSWAPVLRYALLGTAACAVVAGGVAAAVFSDQAGDVFWRAVIGAGAIAAVVAAPLFSMVASERRKFEALRSEVSRLNSTDALTACLNGSVFASLIDAFRGVSATGRQQGALLVVDIDEFREINANYGHAWGDEVLKIVASTIKGAVRAGDLVGRTGGKEFGVFLPGASRENAERVAERIRQSVSETVLEPGGRLLPLSVSVGAVLFDDQVEFDDLFRNADNRLTEAKSHGPNHIAFGELLAGVGERRNLDA